VNAARWIGGLVGVVLVDLGVGFVLVLMKGIENCDDGQWECSDPLYDLLVLAFFAIPAAYVVALLLAAARHRKRTNA
jgi:hypothetical protein